MQRPSKKLQALWYQKLKDEGFNDIEQDNGALKRWDFSSFQDKDRIEEVANYYHAATHYGHTTENFITIVEKYVWLAHSEGLSYRDVCVAIEQIFFVPITKEEVQSIIWKHNNLMDLTRAQLQEET